MEKRFAFAALLVLMTLVSTVGFASADSNGPPPPSSPTPTLPGTTYTFTLSYEGDYYSPSSMPILGGTKGSGYYDTYVLTITSGYTLKVTIVLEDAQKMGDTIALYRPLTTTLKSAKSPALIVQTYTLSDGTYYFYVGYVACPGGFPAGYVIFFDASCGMKAGQFCS